MKEYKSFDDLPVVLTVKDVQETLSIGKRQAYSICDGSHFPVRSLERKKLIPKDSFIEWLHNGDQAAV